MTNIDIAKSYFEQAGAIGREIQMHFAAGEWHLVVRRGQEAVELLLKGMLRRVGVEVPRLHDVGHVLAGEAAKLPRQLRDNMDQIISISRRLRQERETSFYGDDEQELPASALYTEVDARQAKTDVEWLMGLLPM